MKTFILIGTVFLMSAPAFAGKDSTAKSAPVYDPGNTRVAPPVLEGVSPVNGTGQEPPVNMGTGTGFGYDPDLKTDQPRVPAGKKIKSR